MISLLQFAAGISHKLLRGRELSAYGGVDACESDLVFCDFSDQTLKNLAWAEFDECVSSVCNHILHALGPSDRGCKLREEVGLDLFRVSRWLGCNVLIYRAYRSLEYSLFDALGQFGSCRFHERGMEGSTNRKRQCASGTCFL